MTALQCDTCHGRFLIDGSDTVDPAGRWCTYDLRPINSGQNDRGTDTLLPHIDALIENPRRFAPTPLLLPFAIDGFVDTAGFYIGRAGAEGRITTHFAAARALYLGSSRTIAFNPIDGGTWTTRAHVLDIDQVADADGKWNGNLELLLTQPWEIT